MCNKDPQSETPAFAISRGAAMAHGCCGGFRMPQPKAIVIPIETLRGNCHGDCAIPERDPDAAQQP